VLCVFYALSVSLERPLHFALVDAFYTQILYCSLNVCNAIKRGHTGKVGLILVTMVLKAVVE